MTQMKKHAKTQKNITQMRSLLQNHKKHRNRNICVLCHNFEPIEVQTRLSLSFANNIYADGGKLARIGRKTATFYLRILVYSLYHGDKKCPCPGE